MTIYQKDRCDTRTTTFDYFKNWDNNINLMKWQLEKMEYARLLIGETLRSKGELNDEEIGELVMEAFNKREP